MSNVTCSAPFPKWVCVIIGEGMHPKDKENPNWNDKGSIWYAKDQRSLDVRISEARGILASAIYDESKDSGEEWCEIVWSSTHYIVEDFDPLKHMVLPSGTE